MRIAMLMFHCLTMNLLTEYTASRAEHSPACVMYLTVDPAARHSRVCM